MRYVEGLLYQVTKEIDQRGEGEEPIQAGTILRVVEDLGWCVRFERLDNQGEDVALPASDRTYLEPYTAPVGFLERARVTAWSVAKIAAAILIAAAVFSELGGDVRRVIAGTAHFNDVSALNVRVDEATQAAISPQPCALSWTENYFPQCRRQ